MAPTWFQNIRFENYENKPEFADAVASIRRKLEHGLKDITFNSTGPIIEEVESETEEFEKQTSVSPHTKGIDRQDSVSPDPEEIENRASFSPDTDVEEVEKRTSVSLDTEEIEKQTSDPPCTEESQKQTLHSPDTEEVEEELSHSPDTEEVEEEFSHSPDTEEVQEESSHSPDFEEIEEQTPDPPYNEEVEKQASVSLNTEEIEKQASVSPDTEKSEKHTSILPETEKQASISPLSPEPDVCFDNGYESEVTAAKAVSIHSPVPNSTIGPLRRSKRNRIAPVARNRLQRPIYKPDKNGCSTLVGVTEGFPAKYDYSRKKTTTTNRPKVLPKKTKVPTDAVAVDNMRYKEASKGDYQFNSGIINKLITGIVRLKPGSSKPEAKTATHHKYIFLVRTGQILLKVIDPKLEKIDKYYLDENSSFFPITPGSRYSLKNCGSSPAIMAYVVVESDET